MGFGKRIESAYKAFNGPNQEELFSDAQKLDNKIDNNSPIQKSISKLIEKINNSKSNEERYVLEEQLIELNKINELYKNNIETSLRKTTKNEIKSLLQGLENQINSKENILNDDYELLENIIENENEILKDTIDLISENTLRDKVENNINILGIRESIPSEEYQDFFDIATLTYIDLLEKNINKSNSLNQKQIDLLINNKGLYLNEKNVHIFIKELINRLNNKNINFDFELKTYKKTFIINLEKYKEQLEENNRIILQRQKELELQKKLEEKEKNYVLDEATNLIMRHEGFAKISKWDKKQYSRGFGTKAPGKGLEISREKAKKELKTKILKTKKYVEKYFPDITKDQKVALISFFYNTGTSSKGKENLIWRLKNLNKHVKGVGVIKPESVANMIVKYTKSGGKDLDGLIARREEEKKYFLGINK